MTPTSSGRLEPATETSTPVSEAYTRHGLSLRRFIGRLLRGSPDVEDIAQEAFLRAYAVERSRPIEQPKSFLFRIAKHAALSQLTRKSRQMTDYIEDSFAEESIDSGLIQTESSPEDEISAHEILALHCAALEELGSQSRKAYLLRKVHGLSHKEIAAELGIAVSTVEKHLIKAVEHCERYVRERTESHSGREVSPTSAQPTRGATLAQR